MSTKTIKDKLSCYRMIKGDKNYPFLGEDTNDAIIELERLELEVKRLEAAYDALLEKTSR